MIELSENRGVQVRFLLGPAGTGKTFQCLEEIRAELKRSPDGPPLLFLAPKQATFQIERQLLSDPELHGYTRLQTLSFDRLAEFVLETLGSAGVKILNEEGRIMVLRALLAEKQTALRTFRSTARLPGFAQQLSALICELQQQRLSSVTLAEAARDPVTPLALRDKLHDVALLLNAYRDWLKANALHDSEELLELAADALRDAQGSSPRTNETPGSVRSASVATFKPGMQLWLDGFAEMTPQELHLLAAFAPLCERATLAFCLEDEPREQTDSWLSVWSVVGQTFRNCRNTFAALPQCDVRIEVIERDPSCSRFGDSPVLAHIERNWTASTPFAERNGGDAPRTEKFHTRHEHDRSLVTSTETIRIVTCANPEAEAVFAAREILRFVRERSARFRDCAVLLRTLDGYHAIVRRVFTRYGVPFFLDRRESIAHHPLAELTRFALRVAAFGWRNEDWFGVLKTGLVHGSDDDLDRFENEARARGWNGAKWTEPLAGEGGRPHAFESLRRSIMPPFEKLNRALAVTTNGPELAAAIRALWVDLDVATTLQRWTEEMKHVEPSLPAMHETVLSQMEMWLENLERAFKSQSLDARNWLPILEAGLAGLTVGVIPPSLDQVLIGPIDRSRNPDLRLTFVLGMNETVFPAPPPRALILTEAERRLLSDWVAGQRQSLGISARQRIAHERFYAYIACTRSRHQLVLTCAATNSRGVALNPSPFLAHLNRLVPGVFPAQTDEREHFSAPNWHDAQHVCEVAAPLIDGTHAELAPLRGIDVLAKVVQRAEQFTSATRQKDGDDALKLSPALVARLFPSPFTTSVSALEDFAACPFKFFLKHGLRVREREEFEVDHRQKGVFQHEVLSRFHQRATANGKQWRDWSPVDAASLVREIGQTLLKDHHHGLFDVDDSRRFAGETLLEHLERLVTMLVTWMGHYRFDPRAVELEFGLGKSPLPGWRLPLDNGRELVLCGRIDRIDVCECEGAQSLGIVVDYKSSGKKVDTTKLYNGLELQLLSYLGFLRQLAPSEQLPRLLPAGVFYVALRGNTATAASRDEAFQNFQAARRSVFRHEGRFNAAWHEHMDATGGEEQFSADYRVKLPPAAFAQLMSDVEAHLKRLGREILDGKISIEPYRKNQRDTACLHCEFKSICRFDPWIEPYRSLQPVPKASKNQQKTGGAA